MGIGQVFARKIKNLQQTRYRKRNIIEEVLHNIAEATKQKVDNRMYFAVKIQDILAQKGMKKEELATLLKMDVSEVLKWLSGDHNFTIDSLSEIGAALGVNLLQTSDVEVR